jgi:hypothetical protein
MSKSNSDQFVKMMGGPIQPSGSGAGYLLIGVLAVALFALDAYGFKQASDLPPLIGILLAGLIGAVRFFMLRRRSSEERATSGGLDRVAGCAPASVLAVALAAFGIYNVSVSEPPRQGSAGMTEAEREAATVTLEDFHHHLRTEVGVRNNLNEYRLSQFRKESATPEGKTEFDRLEREQQVLRKLLRAIVAGLRPADPAPLPSSGEETDEAAPLVRLGPLDSEASLRNRFAAAAKLHAQLPRDIQEQVALPQFESASAEPIHASRFEQFFRDTLAMTNQAMGSWAVPGILELFLIVLMLINRPRD